MVGNEGYLALKKQSAATTAVTPDVFVPLYEESLHTNLNIDEDNAAFGSKFARLQVLPGQRGHTGDVTVLAEPDSTHLLWNMLLASGSVTGSDPYTWPFTLAGAPGSYTVDISNGDYVTRFIGAQASSISPNYDANKMRWQVSIAALKSFVAAQVASQSGSGPYTVTFDTTYDPAPTTGIVVGDLVQFWDVSTSTYINAEVDAVTGTTVEVSEDVSALVAGDYMTIRPSTVSLDLATPFLWSRTEFRFGATASAALSATHTPLESDTSWTFSYPFAEDEGNKRSGSLDPAALLRLNPDIEFTIRKFLDGPSETKNFINLTKTAVVIRCFSGTGHEFRLTINNLRPRGGGEKPSISSGEVSYLEIPYVPTYDTSDGQAFDVKVINGVAS